MSKSLLLVGRIAVMASLLATQERAAAAEPAGGQAVAQAPAAQVAFSRTLAPETLKRRGHGYVAKNRAGKEVALTLDARLQNAADEVFAQYRLPYAAAVVMSAADGRVLALAGRSSVDPRLGPSELALTPWAPAASVFKVVSAAALVSEAGLSADSRTCYHGGVSAVLADNLVDLPRIDKTCASLGYAIGKSQNAIIAKLTTRHLTPETLDRVARSFGFGAPIPFELPVATSTVDIPENDRLEFARSAAGFWHSTLSPLHGALVAAAIANGGTMPAPRLVADGTAGQPTTTLRRVISAKAAKEIAEMMTLTTEIGTARSAFHDRRGRAYLPVTVAGKTGTLSAQTDKGFVGYSWFVGFAPAQHPQVAFAVAIGNQARWRVKAAHVAQRILATYFGEKPGAARASDVLASR